MLESAPRLASTLVEYDHTILHYLGAAPVQIALLEVTLTALPGQFRHFPRAAPLEFTPFKAQNAMHVSCVIVHPLMPSNQWVLDVLSKMESKFPGNYRISSFQTIGRT